MGNHVKGTCTDDHATNIVLNDRHCGGDSDTCSCDCENVNDDGDDDGDDDDDDGGDDDGDNEKIATKSPSLKYNLMYRD
jgi:hypothetical protein